MSECIFCKIVAGEIPAKKIFEDDDYIAFLDIFPANRGHTLVIPKAHFEDIHSTPVEIYGGIAARAKQIADFLSEKLGTDGISIFQMNREAGWQSVFHVHMHVVPRWSGDALHKPWDISPADEADLASLHSLLTQ